MSIIIIPSKKIYNIDYNKKSNQPITKVNQGYNVITKRYGNVLTQEYSYHYFHQDVRDYISSGLRQPYTDGNVNNGTSFSYDSDTGILTGEVKWQVGQETNFELAPQSGGTVYLTSHKVQSTKTVSEVQENPLSSRTFFETTTIIDAPLSSVNYDRENRTISFPYSLKKTIKGESDKPALEVFDERVSLVGDYITTAEEFKDVGEGKNVLKINPNEIIQSTNGNLYNFANDIIEKYKNGKETAVILCSIGQYYDENGKLVISSKNADKMLFEHYDKVVPMVRSGRRKELAMSYTADGLAKVFDVVGVRVFFDGAVWQELTLLESGEGVDIGRTTYTTIANKAGGLTYKITSNEIVTEENPTRGITYIIGD